MGKKWRHSDLKAQGMIMRETAHKHKSRNIKIWRSLIEASSSSHAWWRRKKLQCAYCNCRMRWLSMSTLDQKSYIRVMQW